MKRQIAAIAALSLVLVACGGGSESTEGVATLEQTTATTTTEASIEDEIDQEQAVLDLVQCLRDEGLDIADPEVDADGNIDMRRLIRQGEDGNFAPEDVDAAMETCGDLADQVRLSFTRDLDITELEDQFLEFAACMRENGYDMPDPDFSNLGQPGTGGGGGGGPFSDIDRDDPDFQAALEQCQDLLAGFGRGLTDSSGGS